MSAEAGGRGGSQKTSVRVTIMGEEYTLRSDASAAHTREVAEHVDRVIRQVLGSGTVVETHKAAILAALQITDELFRARQETRVLGDRIRDLGQDVRRMLPPTKRGDDATG